MAAQKSRGPEREAQLTCIQQQGPPVTRHFATSSAEESSSLYKAADCCQEKGQPPPAAWTRWLSLSRLAFTGKQGSRTPYRTQSVRSSRDKAAIAFEQCT